ncbi:hypothetical protein TrCOL_g12751 [Triparma columacea]|nr:hypothetical protein TrCOL_g12751 [Triparma columacea]
MTAFTFIATYVISYFGFEVASDTPLKVPRRQVNITDFHISTSVDYGIARCIGSVGLPMVGVGFCLIATWRYFYVHAHLPSREGAYTLFPHKRNNMSLICAALSSVGIFGVAAFPSVVHKPAHFFFAFVAFSNIVGYMMMQISLDRSLKLYKLNETEKMLHGARIGMAYIGACGLVGMIVSMKILKKKDYSSAFELMMALSFMAFLCSFFNQLTHVEISISANVNEASGDIGLLTRLDIEDDLDEDDDDEGFGEEEDGVGNNRASFIRNVSKVSNIPTSRLRAVSWSL